MNPGYFWPMTSVYNLHTNAETTQHSTQIRLECTIDAFVLSFVPERHLAGFE